MVVHPDYCLIAGTWRWEEYEAPTLAALQRLLGPGVTIKDYYPDGLGGELGRLFVEKTKRQGYVLPPLPAPLVQIKAGKPKPAVDGRRTNGCRVRKHDHDKILDLWAAGMHVEDITARLCAVTPIKRASVYMIISRARQAGDPRAASRIYRNRYLRRAAA